jgi:lipoate-protein ligase A
VVSSRATPGVNAFGTGGPFELVRRSADAATLHAFEPPTQPVPTLVVGEVTAPALVLGSTQPETDADPERARAGGYEIVRRRSGGGSVWLVPGGQVWVDVWIPAGDPRWDDDVARAAVPIGEAWRAALVELGIGTGLRVHTGGVEPRPWSALVCFAGIGPGEVLDFDDRKWVGISQRRTREWIRLQTMAHRIWDPVGATDALGHRPDAALQSAVGAIGDADPIPGLIGALG